MSSNATYDDCSEFKWLFNCTIDVHVLFSPALNTCTWIGSGGVLMVWFGLFCFYILYGPLCISLFFSKVTEKWHDRILLSSKRQVASITSLKCALKSWCHAQERYTLQTPLQRPGDKMNINFISQRVKRGISCFYAILRMLFDVRCPADPGIDKSGFKTYVASPDSAPFDDWSITFYDYPRTIAALPLEVEMPILIWCPDSWLPLRT